jgi:hypothetical protein
MPNTVENIARFPNGGKAVALSLYQISRNKISDLGVIQRASVADSMLHLVASHYR